LGQRAPRRVEVDLDISSATASSTRWKYSADLAAAHGAIAPSAMREVLVGDDELGVDLELGAEPVQAGQAPNGELNEKLRGSSSIERAVVGAGQVLAEASARRG
jgi:hypothetical protein